MKQLAKLRSPAFTSRCVACLALVAYAFNAHAAVPARFIEWAQFTGVNDGTLASYVDPEVTKPVAYYARAYYDFRLDESQRTDESFLFGTLSDTLSKQTAMSLKSSSGNYYFQFYWLNSRTLPATPGHRYQVGISPETNIGFQRATVVDADTGVASTQFSTAVKSTSTDTVPMLLFNEAYRYAGCANGIKKYSAGQKFYRARVWYNASSSTTPTYDMYPCIDADGRAGLYDRISGNIRYGRTCPSSGGWITSGYTTNYGLLTAPEDIADSTDARVNAGNVEFAATAMADDGAQVSADGVNWTSSVTVWSKAGDADVTLYCRADPSASGVAFYGWASDYEFAGDLLGTTGKGTTTLTVPAGQGGRFNARAMRDGVADDAIVNGDFETPTAASWNGQIGTYATNDTSVVNAGQTSIETLGDYVWGFSTVPHYFFQDVCLRPGTYTLAFDSGRSADASYGYRGRLDTLVTLGGAQVYSNTFTYGSAAATTMVHKDYTVTATASGVYRIRFTRRIQTYTESYAQWVDNVKLTINEPYAGIKVAGESGVEAVDYRDAAGLPYYGNYPMGLNESITFVAPIGKKAAAGQKLSVAAYRVDTWDAEGKVWIKGAKNFGTSYTHTQASAEASDYKRLVWLWGENKGFAVLVY